MTKVTRTIRLADSNDQKEWDSSVSHPLQSWAWGEFRRSMGLDVVRLNGWQLTFHKLPGLPYTVGFLPRGPEPTAGMMEELVRLGREKKAIFIQLEPNVLNDVRCTMYDVRNVRLSFHPLFPKYTFVLDLTKSETELLKAMHHKTRYNIRLAQKHKVVVQEDNSDKAFEAYLKLEEETTKRQGFYAHNEAYRRNVWEIMHRANIARLFTASYKNTILAAWIIFAWKDTLYYPYGASSRQHREIMAPNLLLWEIAKWGKMHGYKGFDLWGALGPSPDPNDPWYGFHRFKEGYRPDLVEFIGSYDLVISPPLYELYKLADRLRWIYLKFRKKIF